MTKSGATRFRNRQGDELPDWVANKVERPKKIREAKAALEQEAADRAKAEKKDDEDGPPEPPKVDPGRYGPQPAEGSPGYGIGGKPPKRSFWRPFCGQKGLNPVGETQARTTSRER